MHRLILSAPPGVQVDHIDGLGLNNRRSNLRLCDGSQNQANRRRGRGLSAYKGVSFNPKTRKWRVAVARRRASISIGEFAVERDAALAYDVAARAVFGDFCAPNFPKCEVPDAMYARVMRRLDAYYAAHPEAPVSANDAPARAPANEALEAATTAAASRWAREALWSVMESPDADMPHHSGYAAFVRRCTSGMRRTAALAGLDELHRAWVGRQGPLDSALYSYLRTIAAKSLAAHRVERRGRA